MSGWKIRYTDNTFTFLEAIDRPIRHQIINRLEWFVGHFDELYPDALHEEWKGFYKFRIGDWRVVYNYETSKRLITVHHIDRRDKVYKKRK